MAAPTVTSISPSSGPLAGGTSVTIAGTDFTTATGATVGGAAVTSFTVVSDTSITCVTPSGTAGAKDVVVTNPDGDGTLSAAFTYVAAPTVTSISPDAGPLAGGQSVTISGANFTEATGVTIGGSNCTSVTVVSDTSITCVTPAGTAGAKSVVVTTPYGTGTLSAGFTYVAAPTNTAAPAFTAQPTKDVAVTIGNGTWTGSPTFAYQWQRASNGSRNSWTDISGATSATYTPTASDEGYPIRCKVTGTNAGGSTDAFSHAPLVPNAQTKEILADNPRFFYRHDEAAGVTTTYDAAFSGRNGSSSGGSRGIAGATADGNAAYASARATADGSYLVAAPYTIEAWFKRTGATTNEHVIFRRYSSTSNAVAFYIDTWNTTTGSAVLSIVHFGSLGGGASFTCPNLANGNWHHVAAVAVGSSQPIRLYVDGAEVASATLGSNPTYGSGSLVFGGGNRLSTAPGDTNQTYDETAYFSTALSAARIAAHYENAIAAAAPVNGGLPTITGTTRPGQTLTATTGYWSSNPVSRTYAYQWQTSANGTSGWSDIAGATSSTYALTSANNGQYLRVQVTATNSQGSATATSAATTQVGEPPVSSVLPVISGTAVVGQVLSATSGTWTGYPASFTYAYQWQRSADGGSTWSNISGATSATYTTVSADAPARVRCQVTATNTTGSTAAQSASVLVRAAGLPAYVNAVLDDAPAAYFRLGETSGTTGADISGNGHTITYTNGPVINQPGALSGDPSAYFDGSNDFVVSSLTAGTFNVSAPYTFELWLKPDAVDMAFASRDMALYIGNAGAYTPNFAFTGFQIYGGNLEFARNTGSVGAAATVAISAGSWTHVVGTWDGTNLRLYKNGVLVSTQAGAGAATISLNAAAALNLGRYPNSLFYAGFADELAVYPSALSGARVLAHYEAHTRALTNLSAPALSGAATLTGTLTCSTGTWDGYPAPTYAYQWESAPGTSDTWSTVSGATASTLTGLTGGYRYRCTVTATNSEGSASATSAAGDVVPYPPSMVEIPVLSGSFVVGETVSVSAGTWTGYPEPSIIYRWYAGPDNNVPLTLVSGATSSSFTLTEEYAGQYIMVSVQATNSEGNPSVSLPGGQVAYAPYNTTPPSASGTFAVGQTVTATAGEWDGLPEPTISYQWQSSADGLIYADIAGATATTLVIGPELANTLVRCRVRATNAHGTATEWTEPVLVPSLPSTASTPLTILRRRRLGRG